jgi:quinol monooxygenase YgiN
MLTETAMQRVTLVRYTTKPEHAAENEALSRAVFEELRGNAPTEVAYALLRDGNDFTHVFVNLKVDESAAVTELPTFKEFQKDMEKRCVVAPQVTRVAASVVEAFGFGGRQ